MMFQQPSNEAPSLDDYLKAVGARKWTVAIAMLIGLGVSLAYQNYRTDLYEASASVVIGPSRRLSLDSNRAVSASLERESELVLGDSVLSATADILGTSLVQIQDRAADISVKYIPESDVFRINGVDDDPEFVTAMVNGIANSYVEQTEDAEAEFFRARIAGLEETINSNTAQLTAIDAELAVLLAEREVAQSLPADDISRATRISGIDADRSVRNTNRQQLIVSLRSSETELRGLRAQLLTRPATAALVSPATFPSNSEGLGGGFLNIVGIVLGAGAGVAAALVLVRLDRRARGRDDIELALGQRVLASVPSFGFGLSAKRGEGALVMSQPAKSPRALHAIEAFRRLRTGVNFLAQSEDLSVFMLSSAHPGEGKSTVTANLGIAFAQGGQRTVMVSADLRRPSLEKLFAVDTAQGLSEWLGGDDEIDVLVDLPEDNLHMVPAGKPAANSSELLSSERFKALIEELRSVFDIVLIDTPPILATADAGAASKYVDGVIVVVNSRETETDQLLRVRSDLDRAGSSLIGAVLNRERQKRALPWRKRDRYSYAYV